MKFYKDSSNNVFAYEADGSQDHLIGNKVVITQEEADSIASAAQAAFFNSLTYAQKRASAYPSIADQLDQIYHEGIDAWKATIAAVKQEYPKP
jgi:hypothetical protein